MFWSRADFTGRALTINYSFTDSALWRHSDTLRGKKPPKISKDRGSALLQQGEAYTATQIFSEITNNTFEAVLDCG